MTMMLATVISAASNAATVLIEIGRSAGSIPDGTTRKDDGEQRRRCSTTSRRTRTPAAYSGAVHSAIQRVKSAPAIGFAMK
jgi:hypothetical protein